MQQICLQTSPKEYSARKRKAHGASEFLIHDIHVRQCRKTNFRENYHFHMIRLEKGRWPADCLWHSEGLESKCLWESFVQACGALQLGWTMDLQYAIPTGRISGHLGNLQKDWSSSCIFMNWVGTSPWPAPRCQWGPDVAQESNVSGIL